MSKVQIRCNCGKTYNVDHSVIGKKVKCNSCGNNFLANQDAAKQQTLLADALGELDAITAIQSAATAGAVTRKSNPAPATNHCPSCKAPVGKSAVICTSCGFDFRTSKQIVTNDKIVYASYFVAWPKVLRVTAAIFACLMITATIAVIATGFGPNETTPGFGRFIIIGLLLLVSLVFALPASFSGSDFRVQNFGGSPGLVKASNHLGFELFRRTTDLKGYRTVRVVAKNNEANQHFAFIFAMGLFLMCFGVLPGIFVLVWLISMKDTTGYILELVGSDGKKKLVASSGEPAQLSAIGKTIAGGAGLEYYENLYVELSK